MGKPLKYGFLLLGLIFIVNFLTSLLFSFLVKNALVFSWLHILMIMLASLFSAFAIAAFVISTAPVLKDFLATWRTLLRFESLSHPLLMKLSSETPGTYNHSLTVANLAHKAAKSIDANALLARVGGYYHDIGKLTHPEAFIENQSNTENLHEDISPKQSAKIILNHVKEGIAIAREYHLPQEIVNIIAEHHGTTLLEFFYEKSLEMNKETDKDNFCYGGPKPMSAESAIVMLADAIEAKIRLVKDVNPKIISQIVDEVIQDRLNSNQLEISGLNATKLAKIRTAFIETLTVINHQRVDYPKTVQHLFIEKRKDDIIK